MPRLRLSLTLPRDRHGGREQAMRREAGTPPLEGLTKKNEFIMLKKYLDPNGLEALLGLMKEAFASAGHTHSGIVAAVEGLERRVAALESSMSRGRGIGYWAIGSDFEIAADGIGRAMIGCSLVVQGEG